MVAQSCEEESVLDEGIFVPGTPVLGSRDVVVVVVGEDTWVGTEGVGGVDLVRETAVGSEDFDEDSPPSR